jgi:mannosyl-oligosaccharide alpha-1,2-mannosidase
MVVAAPTLPSALASAAMRAVQKKRLAAVRGAVAHSWNAYKQYAWGADGLHPLTKSPAREGFNHAVTMVDSLDTLWIVGMKPEFEEAVAWIGANLPTKVANLSPSVSAFETTIRSLGGLEAAHALSGDETLLACAVQLGDKLLANVKPRTGIASYRISGANGGMGCHTLAESGTNQLEFAYLSAATGDPKYRERSDQFHAWLRANKPSVDGLWPNCFERSGGLLTMGADGDSFYEYLLKRWLQGGKKDDALWKMYNDAVDGMEKHLVSVGADGLTYLSNARATPMRGAGAPGAAPRFSVTEDPSMEHLTCFVPGWLALGAPHQRDAARKARHTALAAQLALTCWHMYHDQPTGIAPERVKHKDMSLAQTDTREYILRPEAAESFFILHQLTGDAMYREWGWQMFSAMEKHLKVAHGYAALRDVRDPARGKLDRMESFWIAETLKYLYLLQEDGPPSVDLSRQVLNTEAHPLPLPL